LAAGLASRLQVRRRIRPRLLGIEWDAGVDAGRFRRLSEQELDPLLGLVELGLTLSDQADAFLESFQRFLERKRKFSPAIASGARLVLNRANARAHLAGDLVVLEELHHFVEPTNDVFVPFRCGS
jgi:hypothetical protein